MGCEINVSLSGHLVLLTRQRLIHLKKEIVHTLTYSIDPSFIYQAKENSGAKFNNDMFLILICCQKKEIVVETLCLSFAFRWRVPWTKALPNISKSRDSIFFLMN